MEFGQHEECSKLEKESYFIRQLEKDGYVITFASDAWKISRGVMTIARGKKSSTLYMTTNGYCSC